MTDFAPQSARPSHGSAMNHTRPSVGEDVPRRVIWGRRGFTGLAWLFAASVAFQVFLAGLAVFAGPNWWTSHTTFVHLFELLPLLMLVAAFVGRLPVRLRWLSLAALVMIGLQYATIALGVPDLAALHPVNALLIFWLAIHLATWRGAPAA